MYLLYNIHNSVVICFADSNCWDYITVTIDCCFSGQSFLDPFSFPISCQQWYVVWCVCNSTIVMCSFVLSGCMALFIICMCTYRGKPGGPDKIMCNPSLEGRQFFYCSNSHSNLTTLFSGRQALPVLKLSAQTQESSGKSKESALHPSFFMVI